jgi:thiamine biosynthesis lipoprotein
MARTHSIESAHHFAREAMRTTFHIRIPGRGKPAAQAAANECFERLEAMENLLSRFIEGSDVWQINHMQAGETLYLSEECHECLLAAMDAYQRTGGLFDVTLGRRIEHRKSGAAGPPPPAEGRLIIHPDTPAVTCEAPGREIDLGGIGKGYALDRMAALLAEWDLDAALLSAGASTLLAVGPEAWPVDLAGDGASLRIELRRAALSASGTAIQGAHVVDPRFDEDAAPPAIPWKRVWVRAGTAALADAMSTAALLMDPEELAEFAASPDGPDVVWVDDGTEVRPAPAPNP